MSQIRPTLPQPPAEYDPAAERRRNRRLEEMLINKLERTAAPVFGGIPHAILTGTNAAFAVATATTTVLPFNTTVFNDIVLLDQTSPNFLCPHECTMYFGVQLYQTAALQTGNQTVRLSLYDSVGATELAYVNLERVYMNQNEAFSLEGIAVLSSSYNIDLRLTHNCAGGITLDMTQSKGWIKKITVDPKLITSERGL